MQDTKEPSSTMLYVSNLPFSFEDGDLKNVFAAYKVTTAYVATRRNGRSKGFGFVTFSSSDEQKKAQASLDGKELDGRQLSVKVAHKDERRDERGELREEFKTETREPRKRQGGGGGGRGDKDAAPAADKTPSDTVLYVSNLPFEFTDDDLSKVFAAHKPSLARIARRRNERSKGFGFVEFAHHKDQQAALALDGHTVGDRQISVKVSVAGARAVAGDDDKERNNDRNKNGDRKPKKPAAAAPRAVDPHSTEPSTTTVYVSNLPFEMTDAQLSKLFQDKGHKAVAAHIARKRDNRSKGFGFVEFSSQAEQQKALALDGQTLEDRDISVKIAKKGSETRAADEGAADAKRKRAPRKKADGEDRPAREPRAPREPRAAAPAREKKPSDTLVYVSNLSFDVDDNALAKLFDGLSIKSAHVAVRRNGRSKGFGFVEFASHAEQQKALAKSGTDLAGRTLTVEVANEKLEDK